MIKESRPVIAWGLVGSAYCAMAGIFFLIVSLTRWEEAPTWLGYLGGALLWLSGLFGGVGGAVHDIERAEE